MPAAGATARLKRAAGCGWGTERITIEDGLASVGEGTGGCGGWLGFGSLGVVVRVELESSSKKQKKLARLVVI